jgi:ornithine--oxo-acid transaminase
MDVREKGLPDNTAQIVVCENNFHGKTTTIVSFSIDPEAKNHYGPFMPEFIVIPYNDAGALEEVLNENTTIVGFIIFSN